MKIERERGGEGVKRESKGGNGGDGKYWRRKGKRETRQGGKWRRKGRKSRRKGREREGLGTGEWEKGERGEEDEDKTDWRGGERCLVPRPHPPTRKRVWGPMHVLAVRYQQSCFPVSQSEASSYPSSL